ncbi:YbaB/EbfC family nucleoid-associated protein [Aquihabitans sp. G128]|uniref:YbaB/EbfC family nucleoid-associated protein n=1 Tax=Aquihabitans sp. G128 TaxID=2849779 RepID=UPI001C22AA0A|nr:YbaB/EbfC family nucleoid-associated protein [Aquihabitans sp. G128]QXC59524.1 YbaB/EbfC family nucleoid-associated protein [Aquihabitans sp. G128]
MTPEPDDETPIRPDLVAQGGGLPDGGDGDHLAGVPMDDPLAALLGGGSGGAGGLDLGALMEQASQMQSQMLAAQQAAAETTVEGVAGGGVVRIAVTGGLDFESVTIDPKAVDPDDVEMLQDLVLAALRHAVEQLSDLQQPDIDLGGIDLGNLFGGS